MKGENMTDPYFLGQPRDPGRDVTLLIDESACEDRWDVERRVNAPSKCRRNPVLVGDRPWEESVGAPSVLYDPDEGLFRMWYAVYRSAAWGYQYAQKIERWDAQAHGYPYTVGYAESDDGVSWHKPRLKGKPHRGFDETNIVLTGERKAQGFCVRWTPEHLRDLGQFMLAYRDNVAADGGNNLYLCFSDDGVEWRPYHDNPIYRNALDDEASLTWDERRRRWLLHTRPAARACKESEYRKENTRTRIAVAVSEDLKNWQPTREVLCPDERDGPFFFDVMVAEKYGNQFLGFLAVQPRDAEGKGHIELVSSPDGLQWHRGAGREPFISPGREGDWDGGHVWYVENIVQVGDWIYLYYAGSERPWRVSFPANARGIGMARLKRDRFVGQFGGPEGGYLLSREVAVSGCRLLLNCCNRHRAFTREEWGSVNVELIDRKGTPLPGYTFDDCDTVRVNALDHPVSWNGSTDLSGLQGMNVHIRFFIKSAYVFAFRFSE